jgi:hypothetical protein
MALRKVDSPMPIVPQAGQRKLLSASVTFLMRKVVVTSREIGNGATFPEYAQPATDFLGTVRESRQKLSARALPVQLPKTRPGSGNLN